MISETVYIGRDNTIDLQLKDDTVKPGKLANSDFSAVTKVELVINGTIAYNSIADPNIVSFTPGGVVYLKLGGVLTLPKKHYIGELIIYTAANPDGIAWQPKFDLLTMASKPPVV